MASTVRCAVTGVTCWYGQRESYFQSVWNWAPPMNKGTSTRKSPTSSKGSDEPAQSRQSFRFSYRPTQRMEIEKCSDENLDLYPLGGNMLIFFIHWLGPSIKRSPQKILGISSTPKIYLNFLANTQKISPILYL